MSDWESDSDSKPPAPVAKPPVHPKKSKWEGEDEDDDDPADNWDDESSEEEEVSKPTVAPPKKKGTLKQKLAEKEAEKARKKAAGEDDDIGYDSDQVLDPREKARRDKERQLQSDLNNAADLFGAAALGGTSSSDLDQLISFQPRTKEDFQQFSANIIEYIIKRHQNKPLYHFFVEHHARALAAPLKDVEVRKAASGLTVLANEKQKEQRDKASGKKRTKSATLGNVKVQNKLDTTIYDEALDDYGSGGDDFM